MRNRVANMPPECNGDRGATMRREAGGGQREGERGGMSDLRGQRRPGTRTRPQKTAPSTLLPAFSPGARARAAALGDMNRPTNPGGSACQAARAGRGAREGGTRCGRGLNARKWALKVPGPPWCPRPPGATGSQIAGYSGAVVCVRRLVGRGRLAVAESPASCPHRPPAPPGRSSMPKRREGGVPGSSPRLSPRPRARGRGGHHDHRGCRHEPNPHRRGGAAARDGVDSSLRNSKTTRF